ncbi:tetratricopeptide repeat protein [Pseudodesulfovibrio sp.]|uniref:tetratricopeptide repeat protein n=1 Tax=Pseudodesulfovibrio sp. TaxID=2035812 RepID=UPI00262B1EAC|nr:tetratricopeptide repeat protein [Pseudodesulfovibrio sp.]MDD3311971.1 tetratricopeptide repeat protein [Pseudodesulfovibrio sp.]
MRLSAITLGRRAVILTVVLSAAAMFVTSFVYRMNHPNLFVQVQHQPTREGGMPPGMGEAANGPMAKVKEYMARVDANPDDKEALVGLGNAFLMMRAWDRALIPLAHARELDAGDTGVLKAIGIAYFNKKEFDKADAAYQDILAIEPNDTLALFNLGVINKYYFKKMDVARTYFEKVLSLEKNDSEMIKMARQELAE